MLALPLVWAGLHTRSVLNDLAYPCLPIVCDKAIMRTRVSECTTFRRAARPPSPLADEPSLVDIDGMLMAVDASGNVDIAGRIYPPHQRAR